MKKIFPLILIFVLLLIPPIFAVAPSQTPAYTVAQSVVGLTISTNNPQYIPKNTRRVWTVHVFNATQQIIEDLTCNIFVINESDGVITFSNSTYPSPTGHITFDLDPNVHSNDGRFSAHIFCNTSDLAGIANIGYIVNRSGLESAGEAMIIFVFVLFVFAVGGLFFTLFLNLIKLALLDMKVTDVLFSWFFFFLNILVIHLSGEYLTNDLVFNLATKFMQITGWTNVFLPVVVFTITILYKSFQKKEQRPPGPRELGGFNGY